ncbi:DUF72 domain-containing protein [Rhodococcus sp. TAF43]|uniref:DUF72 domain-containing protein n=1 Tax=unclassified Rhodococcus (in: high G+C Gram-positive bacteria) TaxID=192944 RepID=UPI000E0A2307|nr:DUF72 domain-containing protein [Rhodococcus sp. AG1013]RDI19409.1 uncharacterized protein YecE (DUF72 family) [Rhodococcus sp. AG1013]
MADVRVGISGWVYPGWRGGFYPEGLVHREELAYASAHLTSIEINGSFYALQKPSSFAKWRDETPDGFVFAVKGGRYITHVRRLLDVEIPLANFFAAGVLALRDKLGPILWQLPPNMQFDADRLDAFLALLPRTTTAACALAERRDDKLSDDRVLVVTDAERPIRHALEVRHASFAVPQVVTIAREHGVALVLADTAGKYPRIDETTADFAYARLHGDAELYASGYTDEALDGWAEKVRGWQQDGRDAFVYFDNDMKGYAPFDAMALLDRLG